LLLSLAKGRVYSVAWATLLLLNYHGPWYHSPRGEEGAKEEGQREKREKTCK
jgi:hypothetical protein